MTEEMRKLLEELYGLIFQALKKAGEGLLLDDMQGKTLRELMAEQTPTNENAVSLMTTVLLLQDMERGLGYVLSPYKAENEHD